MKVDVYISPNFQESETEFKDSIVVMIDVLRASTTTCAALYNGAKEVIPCDAADKAVHLYSTLSRESRFLGGEKNGIKPLGFDAGNSPLEYMPEMVKGKTVILNTTNGTKIFLRAKDAYQRIVGGFVNISSVMSHIMNIENANDNKLKIIFICAGNNGKLSYEDTLAAGAFVSELKKVSHDLDITDSALLSMNLFDLHKPVMMDFIKLREHPQYLKNIGFENDIEIALTFDAYPVVPIVNGSIIKKWEPETISQ
jgi:2-phosphosulfolactate phosphatase